MATMDGWHLGMTSARHESGRRGVETISTGKETTAAFLTGLISFPLNQALYESTWIRKLPVKQALQK